MRKEKVINKLRKLGTDAAAVWRKERKAKEKYEEAAVRMRHALAAEGVVLDADYYRQLSGMDHVRVLQLLSHTIPLTEKNAPQPNDGEEDKRDTLTVKYLKGLVAHEVVILDPLTPHYDTFDPQITRKIVKQWCNLPDAYLNEIAPAQKLSPQAPSSSSLQQRLK